MPKLFEFELGSATRRGGQLAYLPLVHMQSQLDLARTNSIKDGIQPDVERLHRWHGSSVLLEACRLLKTDCFVSAAILYHRCCHVTSLRECGVWSVSMASSLLAYKLEEIPVTSRQVVSVFFRI